jgi:hypothetical protein
MFTVYKNTKIYLLTVNVSLIFKIKPKAKCRCYIFWYSTKTLLP